MINDIYVFDDIIEKPYQELIKETLLGGDKPPTVDDVEEEFPWYYTSDITDATHEGPFQGRFGFGHNYVDTEEGVISNFHNLFLGLIKNSCKKINIKKIDILQGRSFLSTPTNIPRDDVDTPHVDMVAPHFVMLYYVCDSDGDTIIYNERKETPDKVYTIKERVTPKQGRVVLFDGCLMHTAEQPINNIRCVVNYNLN